MRLPKTLFSRRTREQIIDTARRLFARNGVDKTTMIDIAEEAGRGRRTVYTYFASKDEVVYAVIARELELLADSLREVANMDLTPPKKLVLLLTRHITTIYEVVMRNGSLRANIFHDIDKVERIRYRFDHLERELIADILREGEKVGCFRMLQPEHTAIILQYFIKGVEVPYIHRREKRGRNNELEHFVETAKQLLYNALEYHEDK